MTQEGVEKEEEVQERWSISLATPQLPVLSPALKRHGRGLQQAGHRAKQLVRSNRRAVLLLLETTKLYQAYAQSLLKAANGLITNQNNTALISSAKQLTLDMSTAYNQLSQSIQSATAHPLQAFLVTHGDAAAALLERYQQAREACSTARRKAENAHKLYLAAHRDAAKACLLEQQPRQQQNSEEKNKGTDDDSPKKSLPKQLQTKLAKLRTCEAKYKQLVEIENERVRQCQRVEIMALETLQKLEQDRLLIFVQSMLKLVAAAKDVAATTETETNISTETTATTAAAANVQERNDAGTDSILDTSVRSTSSVGSFSAAAFGSPSKKRPAFGGIQSLIWSNDEEDEGEEHGSGVMDAETLGLPEDIGELRDVALKRAASCTGNVEIARTLATFLDSVAAGLTQLGKELKKQIHRPESSSSLNSNSYDSVSETMASCHEGSNVLDLWNSLSKILDQEAEEALLLASKLKSFRTEKLNRVIEYGTKILKPAVERDNATWKQLCDAARAKSKAETDYRETSAQIAKVRDRCKSVDSGKALAAARTANRQVSESLANMFSILPNGGEHVMKVLDASTRASVAQHSLEEADQKETKGLQILESAIALTNLSLDAYKTSAEALLKQCEEKQLDEDHASLLKSYASLMEDFRAGRMKRADSMDIIASPDSLAGVDSSLNSWSQMIQQELKADDQEETPGTVVQAEFMLSLKLEDSEQVRKALALVDSDEMEVEADDCLNDETENDDNREDHNQSPPLPPPTTPIRERAASATLERSPGQSSLESNWLLRSISMSDSSDSIFSKMSLTKTLSKARQPKFEPFDTETSIFATYFLPKKGDTDSISNIVDSFACSFRHGNQSFPFQYGRVFTSKDRFIFVGWTRKQLSLKWSEIVDVEPVLNKLSSLKDSFVVKCKTDSIEKSCVVFSGFYDLQKAFDKIQKLREEANSATISPTTKEIGALPSTPEGSAASIVPADSTYGKMHSVLSRKIRNLSIERFYGIVWSEGNGTNEKPLYQPWLENECFDIEMGDWQVEECTGPWCGESYTQKRDVNFKIKRKTHLYIGPPIANVSQTHYCRVEGNDKCVLAMEIKLDGIPYGDTFVIAVRWVARRLGERDIIVEVGVEVDFKKSTLMKSKIRSGTIEETVIAHKELFEVVKAACIAASGEEAAEEEEAEAMEEVIETVGAAKGAATLLGLDQSTVITAACGALVLFVFMWRFYAWVARGSREEDALEELYHADLAALGSKIDKMEAEIKAVQSTLDEILALLKANKK